MNEVDFDGIINCTDELSRYFAMKSLIFRTVRIDGQAKGKKAGLTEQNVQLRLAISAKL